jgi:hypothetical protein
MSMELAEGPNRDRRADLKYSEKEFQSFQEPTEAIGADEEKAEKVERLENYATDGDMSCSRIEEGNFRDDEESDKGDETPPPADLELYNTSDPEIPKGSMGSDGPPTKVASDPNIVKQEALALSSSRKR